MGLRVHKSTVLAACTFRHNAFMGKKLQRVGSHQRKTGRDVDAYVRLVDDHTPPSRVDGPRIDALREATRTISETFPNPAVQRNSRIGVSGIVRRLFPKKVQGWSAPRGVTRGWVNPITGKGKVVFWDNNTGQWGGFTRKEVKLKPNMYFNGDWLNSFDYRGVNLNGSLIRTSDLDRCDFRNSNLDNVAWYDNQYRGTHKGPRMVNLNFDGSSCRGMSIAYAEIGGRVSLRGCDVEGMKFSGVKFEGNEMSHYYGAETVLDLRDTNVTEEQLDQIAEFSSHLKNSDALDYEVMFPSLSFSEACDRLGVDEEVLDIMIWSGGIGVRDRRAAKGTNDTPRSKMRFPTWEFA